MVAISPTTCPIMKILNTRDKIIYQRRSYIIYQRRSYIIYQRRSSSQYHISYIKEDHISYIKEDHIKERSSSQYHISYIIYHISKKIIYHISKKIISKKDQAHNIIYHISYIIYQRRSYQRRSSSQYHISYIWQVQSEGIEFFTCSGVRLSNSFVYCRYACSGSELNSECTSQ
jgi:hypothetical protein